MLRNSNVQLKQQSPVVIASSIAHTLTAMRHILARLWLNSLMKVLFVGKIFSLSARYCFSFHGREPCCIETWEWSDCCNPYEKVATTFVVVLDTNRRNCYRFWVTPVMQQWVLIFWKWCNVENFL